LNDSDDSEDSEDDYQPDQAELEMVGKDKELEASLGITTTDSGC
jgi:hypothetical protein